MRRKLLLLVFVAGVALAVAGIAAAANGGWTPQYAHSPNTARTNSAYYLILGFTSLIFVIVEGVLILFVWKYRSRGRSRSVEGVQVHGHTRLELLWTAGPVIILAIIATFVFVKLPGISNAPAAGNALTIKVVAHQFYWEYEYPSGARSIGDLHVPVGQPVELDVTATDVIHSWWVPQLAGKIQAIPGRVNHQWFQADHTGVYQGFCAMICGVYHASMLTKVIAEPAADYTRYVEKTAPATLGAQEWHGACATCHGMSGQGGYGPPLSSSPLVTQQSSLVQILRNGLDTPRAGAMPPVGNSWTNAQISALVAYVKKNVYKGATSGG